VDPIAPLDVFGLRPLAPALRAALASLRGSPYTPRQQFGPSSVRIFKPQISIATWLGRRRADKRVPIYNFFNRVPQPRDEGYSVEVTYCRDFRGGRWTYDGHLGTDFACPVGTRIVAGAPGVVVRVRNDIDRGGLKVCIDHGEGLFTTHNHLARALVTVGARVERGECVGLSGASGLEFVMFFPWVAPHLHYNTWLDGEPADPFAIEGEPSLWREHNDPVPHRGVVSSDNAFRPTEWDPAGVDAAIDCCRDPELRASMRAEPSLVARAAEVLVQRSYRPALFSEFPPVCRERFGRRPRLDLPFAHDDFVGVWMP
jgi:murein DD-endopeptidase